MQHKTLKQIRTEKILAWLRIALGAFFLAFAAYRYLSHDNNLAAVNVTLTVIFGITFPAMAIGKLIALQKEEKQLQDENTWQEAEII